jgi:hypothetical protein
LKFRLQQEQTGQKKSGPRNHGPFHKEETVKKTHRTEQLKNFSFNFRGGDKIK